MLSGLTTVMASINLGKDGGTLYALLAHLPCVRPVIQRQPWTPIERTAEELMVMVHESYIIDYAVERFRMALEHNKLADWSYIPPFVDLPP